MLLRKLVPTGNERPFADAEVLVSKSGTEGRIVYVNEAFVRLRGYAESASLR